MANLFGLSLPLPVFVSVPLSLRVSLFLCQMLARQSQRCPRDCSGVLAVTFLEEAQRLLSRFVCVYFGYISQRAAGGVLVGWWTIGGGITRGDVRNLRIALTF